MLRWWAANWKDVCAIVGILIGVVGAFVSIRGWKRKKPIYLGLSNNLFSGLGNKVPDVEVKFSGYGQPITALTVTKIAFWNAGTETIKKQDIVKEDPVTIVGKQGVVLLSANVLDSVSPHNKFECKLNQDRSRATVTFEYIDHNQGTIIQVFHTGTSNADITVQGTIIGASPIRRKPWAGSNDAPLPLWSSVLLVAVLWLLWALYAFEVIPASWSSVPPGKEKESNEVLAAMLTVGTIVWFSVLYLFHIPKPFLRIFGR